MLREMPVDIGMDASAGVALESNLIEGGQPFKAGDQPEGGLSITDACIGWSETEALLHELADGVRKTIKHRRPPQLELRSKDS